MNSQAQTLESEWQIYFDACFPNGCPDIQKFEMRQAFFAGCLIVLKHAVESSQQLPQDQAFHYIFDLIKEAQTVCANRVYETKGRN